MAFNVFYSMVKEYAEELVKKNASFIPSADARLCALLTSSHDIIAGVTSISLYNGSVSIIPAEYMAAVAMNNIGQTKVLRMITISLADFSVVTPDPSDLDIINSFDPENMKCEVFVSASESVLVASLMGENAYVSEEAQPQNAPESEPAPELRAAVNESAPNTVETVPVKEASSEKTLEEAMESFTEALGEVSAEASNVEEEKIKPETVTAVETVSVPEETSGAYMEEIPSAETDAVEAMNDLVESALKEASSVAEETPVQEISEPEIKEPEDASVEEIKEAPKSDVQTNIASFFGGFGDDDDSVAPDVDADELGKMGFLTNSAPKIAPVELEKPKTKMVASPPEYSKSVNIDENNPFYEAENSDSAQNKVVYFSEMNKNGENSGAVQNGVNSQQAHNKPEELSMDEMLKQAKKRKKIAKANFNFRKK